MLAKYFSIIRNYVLSVSLQRRYNFYHQNMLLGAFQRNSCNIIDRNPSMVIPLLANQDLMPVLAYTIDKKYSTKKSNCHFSVKSGHVVSYSKKILINVNRNVNVMK